MFFTPIFQNYFQQLKRLPQERLLQREISDLKKIDFSELEKGDLCLLINPNNPTGHVFSLTEIEEMLIRIKQRKAIAVLDISWINTVFEKQNIFSKDDIGKLVIKYDMILLAGFTKMFGLTGIRCSGFIANPTLVKEFIKIHTEVSISCGSLDEYMVKKFMQKFPIDWKKATKELNELKEYTIFLLKKLKTNFKIIKPKAGVFLYLYSETINDSEIIAKECLKRGVLLYPSTIFEDKKNGVRICFAESKENLKKGIEIFGDVLA